MRLLLLRSFAELHNHAPVLVVFGPAHELHVLVEVRQHLPFVLDGFALREVFESIP